MTWGLAAVVAGTAASFGGVPRSLTKLESSGGSEVSELACGVWEASCTCAVAAHDSFGSKSKDSKETNTSSVFGLLLGSLGPGPLLKLTGNSLTTSLLLHRLLMNGVVARVYSFPFSLGLIFGLATLQRLRHSDESGSSLCRPEVCATKHANEPRQNRPEQGSQHVAAHTYQGAVNISGVVSTRDCS